MRLATRINIVLAVTAAMAIAAGLVAVQLVRVWRLPVWSTYAVGAAIALPFVLLSAHMIVSRITELHAVLGNALSAFREGDFGLRLAVRGDRELAELKALYNDIADAVRNDRHALHEKEILLDTILQRTPVAVVLLNAAERVVYSNTAARQLLAGGARLNDRLLPELPLAAPLRDALAGSGDALFSHDEEMFHLAQRVFHLNTQRHRLVLIERLTPELRRQEVAVWKRAIRVMNHEINNTVAPISSLFHSARRAQEMPEHRHRLDEIYGLIEERLAFLRTFLAAYADFARLPAPRREPTAWSTVIDAVRPLYAFRVEGDPSLVSDIDPAQMQQVLINLVKNAHESGSDAEEIVVSVERAGSETVLRVADRGRGMSESVLRQALVPFYSTKAGGTGVGLALSNEIVEAHGGRLRLRAREGGGMVVICSIP
jgi:two-component system, NtrC family, nitrogen regulation sensor histidine kinase NtrY